MNTLKDLLKDLAYEAIELNRYSIKAGENIEKLTEDYHNRFIKEISKYLELEAK